MTNGAGERESNRHDHPASHKVVVDQAVLVDFIQGVTNTYRQLVANPQPKAIRPTGLNPRSRPPASPNRPKAAHGALPKASNSSTNSGNQMDNPL